MLQALNYVGANWNGENGYGVIRVEVHSDTQKLTEDELKGTIICLDELHAFLDDKCPEKSWFT